MFPVIIMHGLYSYTICNSQKIYIYTTLQYTILDIKTRKRIINTQRTGFTNLEKQKQSDIFQTLKIKLFLLKLFEIYDINLIQLDKNIFIRARSLAQRSSCVKPGARGRRLNIAAHRSKTHPKLARNSAKNDRKFSFLELLLSSA